jgi:hypothetical protein
VRFLGALLFVLGGAGAGWSTWAAYHHRRPRDLAFALAAPLALVVALVGLLLCFVPRFFG